MRLSRLLASVALASLSTPVAMAAPGYLRTPSIVSDTIAFNAEQSVWTVPRTGGTAHRLTDATGADPHPLLSPDGKKVAFVASFDGPTELYVMPVSGGTPRRITYENQSVHPIGWDRRAGILYSTAPPSGPELSRIVVGIDPDTGTRHVYPLADANDAALSSDGQWIYFVRFGTAISRDHLRAYRGGAVSQLWRYRLKGGNEAERIGPQDINLRRPMLWHDRLIVVSDQNGRDNLWSYALDGSDPQQLTHHIDFGVRDASLSGDHVVYQLGADLHDFDLSMKTDSTLPIDIASDDAARRPQWLSQPFRYLNTIVIAPKGDQVALTVRGHVILAATGERRRIQIADPDTVRLRHAAISPDGTKLYAFSDASGESELWSFPTNGDGHGTQLTHGNRTEPTGLYVAPDGKHIAHTDMSGRLRLFDVASGTDTVIDDATKDGTTAFDTLAWSADSRGLVFVRTRGDNIRRQIALFTLADSKTTWLTDGTYESYAPSFSPDGHWLWFLSDRTFNLDNDSPWGDRNFGPVFSKRTGVYALALQPGETFPFKPRTELDAPKPATPPKNNNKPASPPHIVTAGLAQRLYHAPVPAGDYDALGAANDFLFVQEAHGDTKTLKSIHIDNDDHKIEDFAADLRSFDITPDGKTILLVSGAPHDVPKLRLVPSADKAPKEDKPQNTVSLAKLRLRVDPGAEWQEMFDDAWRLHRDHFYDRNLRGVDWNAVRDRYRPLVQRLGDRSDLDDLLGQMVGEVSALHSQLRPADTGARPATDLIAGLGAHLTRQPGGFIIDRIYAGDPNLPDELSPLLAQGVDAREGDLITAINGQSLAGAADLSTPLADQAGRQVLLTLKRKDRTITTVTVATSAKRENALRYRDWEIGRAQTVAKASGGRIGYLHLQAMEEDDIASFARDFYANLDKDGLIIDVRRNMGGNIDSWILTQLLRRAWMFWGRYDNAPAVNMQQAFRGHIVVLCDEFTYSDGETFSQGIKSLHIAPLVGMRTAGAGVWLSDSDRLIDSGAARTAEMPYFDMNGHWLVENHGVEPDKTVENMPVATFRGKDQQLSAAIEMLQQELKEHPVPKLAPEAFPPATPAPAR